MMGRSVMVVVVLLACGGTARAQGRPAVPAAPPAFAVRLFGDAGLDQLHAGQSFNAVFGRSNGPVFGGGAELALRSNWWVRVGAWRFRNVGERAVRLENRTFRLGIPLTITIVPIEASAGYRFGVGRTRRFIPYVGAGVSSHAYSETSAFSDGNENVRERFTGYQALGGLEYRLHRRLGIAGEVQYTTVPDALGAAGLSAEFDETDLGGLLVRARVIFGR